MPARNCLKEYVENSYYHIYNRGVERRLIFQDEQDYAVFLSYLKEYLSPKNTQDLRERLSNPGTTYKERNKIVKSLRLNNFAEEMALLAYCLMPNHFHFFVKQKSSDSIDRFMQSLGTRYAMYFNQKYKRVGPLFQAVYKAVLVTSEEQFVYLSKYIHKQVLASQGLTLRSWQKQSQSSTLQEQPSSYLEYLGKRNTSWIHPKEVLSYFSKTNPTLSYQAFVNEPDDFSGINAILIEG